MIAALLGVMLAAAPPPGHRYAGETYTCLFPKAGRVIIDTREPGSSITYRGKKYPVRGGSYFYVSDTRPEVAAYFGPRMKFWEWGEGGERATSCARRANRR